MSKNFYSNLSVGICIASLIGIVISPSIPVTAAVLVVGGGLALIGLSKIQNS